MDKNKKHRKIPNKQKDTKQLLCKILIYFVQLHNVIANTHIYVLLD